MKMGEIQSEENGFDYDEDIKGAFPPDLSRSVISDDDGWCYFDLNHEDDVLKIDQELFRCGIKAESRLTPIQLKAVPGPTLAISKTIFDVFEKIIPCADPSFLSHRDYPNIQNVITFNDTPDKVKFATFKALMDGLSKDSTVILSPLSRPNLWQEALEYINDDSAPTIKEFRGTYADVYELIHILFGDENTEDWDWFVYDEMHQRLWNKLYEDTVYYGVDDMSSFKFSHNREDKLEKPIYVAAEILEKAKVFEAIHEPYDYDSEGARCYRFVVTLKHLLDDRRITQNCIKGHHYHDYIDYFTNNNIPLILMGNSEIGAYAENWIYTFFWENDFNPGDLTAYLNQPRFRS